MDLNLTVPIWDLHVDQAAQEIIKLPLIVVAVGSIITYFITVTIEEQKHRRELKRQVYFELIDVITRARKVYDDNRLNPLSEDPTKDKERRDKEIEIAYAFQAAKFKAYVGGSKEFNRLIDTTLPPDVIRNSDIMTYQGSIKALTDQMTRELVKPTIRETLDSISRLATDGLSRKFK